MLTAAVLDSDSVTMAGVTSHHSNVMVITIVETTQMNKIVPSLRGAVGVGSSVTLRDVSPAPGDVMET